MPSFNPVLPEDDGPPPNLDVFAESERALRVQATTELEDLIRLIEKWLEMPLGMQRRDPFWTGSYVRGAATKLLNTLKEVTEAHRAADLAVDSMYTDISIMLVDERAENWPEGLSADHVYELNAYLRFLAPNAPAEEAKPSSADEEVISATQEYVLIAAVKLEAFDETSACVIDRIIEKAGVGSPSARNVRAALTRLRTKSLLKAKRGRNGGVWITPAGRAKVEPKIGQNRRPNRGPV